MQIVIKKAGIKGSLFLSYEFEQTDMDVKNTIKTSSDAPIHDDLRIAFRKLIPHFALICEEVKDVKLVEKAIKNYDGYLGDAETATDDTFFKYRVHEFSIVEKHGDEKVYISGSKQLKTHKEIHFSTPGNSLVMDDDYKFTSELNETVELLKKEVLLYMQGKQAPKAQTELFNEEDDDFDAFQKQMEQAG